MKQRIRVVAIIKEKDKVLVLKRSQGRSDTPVFWELPTGKIKFGEQPEEAIARTLEEEVGLSTTDIRIKDAITFVALEGSSRLDNLYIVYEVAASGKPVCKSRYSAYKYIGDFDIANVHLNGASSAVLEIENGKIITSRLSHRSTASSHMVYIDGASRGNPGPSGIGYCIRDVDGKIIERGGEFIGFTTARSAEYLAMKKGIERTLELGIKSAQFISDSLMVINQLNGIMKPKNADIIPTFNTIEDLLKNFDSVSFTHVPREENQAADEEANKAIDNILIGG
ncbi:reverse transcriptase-like protein [Candidatus Saccharibacteria bacterium]|nr:reverse transcriptase-like protein [Candidatus Saccharibacteria bacterium]